MFRARLVAAVVLFGAFAAFAASPAGAARPVGFPELLTTTHFEIHYTGDLGPPPDPSRIVDQTAGDLGANAERAYATITSWGYPPPLDDGDGHIDIWVADLTGTGAIGYATPDNPAATTSTAWIAIDPTEATSEHLIAHELFHAIQFGIWFPADTWLLEATAEWTGFAADNYDPTAVGATKLSETLAQPDMSLDCITQACGNAAYENGGYSRWSFFQYMAERYGNSFVKDVFQNGATAGNPAATGVTLLANTLQAKGTTLSDVFNDYATVVVSGGLKLTALAGQPPTTYSTASVGTTTGALAVQRVAVNHLAARFLDFTHGTSGDTGQCYAATLALTVALPAGIGSKPAFYSTSVGVAAVPLSISGTTASVTVPWNTCFGGADGYLSLPNPSLATDSAMFTVSGTLTVDKNTPATAQAPPTAIFTGPTIASPTADVAPSILVYGAQILRVSSVDRIVRLIVFSSGPGQLKATAGTRNLGTYQLRAGNNDVRFKLPQALVDSLRKPAGARAADTSVLTLTCLSPGGVAGVTVARKLTVIKPSAKKAKH